METLQKEKITIEDVNQKLNYLIEHLTEPKEVFTFQEACEYLNVGKTTLNAEIDAGNIRFKRKGIGNQKLFKKIWLDDWMEM